MPSLFRFVAFATAFSAALAQADTLLVPEQFGTIQAAITFASDGDQVSVAPGVYREKIDLLGKRVVVASRLGAAETVIDGTGLGGYVVRAASNEASGAALAGFTVRGGAGTALTAGGGLLVSSSVAVTGCVFVGNTALNGAAVLVASGSPRFVGCLFRDNRGEVFGAVYDESVGSRYEDCTFEDNFAGYGGGGLAAVGRTTVLGSRFVRNGTNGSGGGLFLAGGREGHIVDRCLFLNNGSAERTQNSTIFYTYVGGGLYTNQATAKISRCRFTEGQAYKGGGVYVSGQSQVSLVNNVFDRNVSGIGGGICINSASPLIVNCTVVNNFGGIFTTAGSAPTIVNTISAYNASGIVNSLDIYGSGRAHVAFSVVGDPVLNGFGSLDRVTIADPKLLADFRLRPGSPAIDAGDSTAVPAGFVTDFFGGPRFLDDPNTPNTGIGNPPVDIGATEYQPRPVRTNHIAH